MKKFKWSVTTTFFLTFSSVVALVSVPIVIKLSSNKLITNVESHQQDGNAIGYDTFAPNKNNQLSGVQGQTITLSYLVSPEIRSFLVLNRQTNDTILVGQIKQKTKLEFKLTLPFNQTSLQLGIWLYPSSSLAVSIWHTKPVGVVSYAMKYVDVKILQPYAEQLTKTTISSNLTNQNFSISSTIPKIINAPFNETPTYYWQNTIDQSLIQTHTTDDGQKLLFPEDEIAKNYGQTYRLIAKFDKYNKAIDVSGSSFTIIKPIKYPANQENKPINENKIKNKSNNFFDQLPSNIKISSNLRGVLGQRVNLKVNFYEVANSSNVNFKLLDNLGANYQFKLQVNKGYNELIIPVYLPFNKTQETYILEIEWNNKKYISKIPTTILLPKANDLKFQEFWFLLTKLKVFQLLLPKLKMHQLMTNQHIIDKM